MAAGAAGNVRKPGGQSGFELLGMGSPKLQGKKTYTRFFVRNLHPDLPDEIDLVEWLNRAGVAVEIDLVDERRVEAVEGQMSFDDFPEVMR